MEELTIPSGATIEKVSFIDRFAREVKFDLSRVTLSEALDASLQHRTLAGLAWTSRLLDVIRIDQVWTISWQEGDTDYLVDAVVKTYRYRGFHGVRRAIARMEKRSA